MDKETDTVGGTMRKACHNGATKVHEELRKRANPFEKITLDGDGNSEAYAQNDFQRV